MLVAGSATGEALVLDEPLSFWGGIDPATGLVAEPRHPQHGASVVGRILVMPAGRGSSSSSSVLAEAIRHGSAPRALLLAEVDQILVLGALVAQLLDGRTCPVAVIGADDYARLCSGDAVELQPGGSVTVRPASADRC